MYVPISTQLGAFDCNGSFMDRIDSGVMHPMGQSKSKCQCTRDCTFLKAARSFAKPGGSAIPTGITNTRTRVYLATCAAPACDWQNVMNIQYTDAS